MSEEKDELIKAQNEVIGVLFEIIKRFQTNNDLTDEYLKLSIKEKVESDNERLADFYEPKYIQLVQLEVIESAVALREA